MEGPDDAAAGILIIRAWTEEAPQRVRARIVEQAGTDRPRQRAAEGADDICRVVRDFVDRLGPAAPG